jgi:hypothetical protein
MTSRPAFTHVVLVLDETGSMEPIREETIGGLKEWLSGLKTDLPGETPVTFVRFNSNGVTRAIDGAPLSGVPASVFDAYAPNYMTPLYDAVGRTILETERRVGKDDGVIFTVMTDGHENASAEFSAEQVRTLVERRAAEGWKFMFLGADIDAYDASRRLGFADADTVSMKKGRMREAFVANRAKAQGYDSVRRAHGAKQAANETWFSESDRQELGEDERPGK